MIDIYAERDQSKNKKQVPDESYPGRVNLDVGKFRGNGALPEEEVPWHGGMSEQTRVSATRR